MYSVKIVTTMVYSRLDQEILRADRPEEKTTHWHKSPRRALAPDDLINLMPGVEDLRQCGWKMDNAKQLYIKVNIFYRRSSLNHKFDCSVQPQLKFLSGSGHQSDSPNDDMRFPLTDA